MAVMTAVFQRETNGAALVDQMIASHNKATGWLPVKLAEWQPMWKKTVIKLLSE